MHSDEEHGITINVDELWSSQERNHKCEKDTICDGCKEEKCELCTVHSCPDGNWISLCKLCNRKDDFDRDMKSLEDEGLLEIVEVPDRRQSDRRK